ETWFLVAAWLRSFHLLAVESEPRLLGRLSLRPAAEGQGEAIILVDLGLLEIADDCCAWEVASSHPEPLQEIEIPTAPTGSISLQSSATVILVVFAAKCVRRKFRA
ncbi:unnamed protein product, partial [Symbiodinium pilosum]